MQNIQTFNGILFGKQKGKRTSAPKELDTGKRSREEAKRQAEANDRLDRIVQALEQRDRTAKD